MLINILLFSPGFHRGGAELSPGDVQRRCRGSSRDTLALGDEGGCRRLDPRLELGHYLAARQAGRDRRQDLQDDAARSLEKAAAAPEQPGIDGDGDERDAELRVERGDAGMVGTAGADPTARA